MCISLIQEQAARAANSAMGVTEEVTDLDIIEIVPRQRNFLGDKGEDDPEAVPIASLPGEVVPSVSEDESRDDEPSNGSEKAEEEPDKDDSSGDDNDDEDSEDNDEDDDNDSE